MNVQDLRKCVDLLRKNDLFRPRCDKHEPVFSVDENRVIWVQCPNCGFNSAMHPKTFEDLASS